MLLTYEIPVRSWTCTLLWLLYLDSFVYMMYENIHDVAELHQNERTNICATSCCRRVYEALRTYLSLWGFSDN